MLLMLVVLIFVFAVVVDNVVGVVHLKTFCTNDEKCHIYTKSSLDDDTSDKIITIINIVIPTTHW